MSNINFSSTLPAAAAGHTNVAFAVDGSNDISASIATPLVAASNLSDVAAVATARSNLGLGAAALLATPIPIASGGTGAITAAAALLALTGGWQSFTPTLVAGGTGTPTFSAPTSVNALYLTIGGITFIRVTFTTTIGGAPAGGSTLNFNLPVADVSGVAIPITGYKSNTPPTLGTLQTGVTLTSSTVNMTIGALTGSFGFTFLGFYQST